MVRTRSKSVAATPESKPSQIDPKPSVITQTQKPSLRSSTAITASSLKSVLLYDWWLVKANDGSSKGLAVGGFASREYERAGLRVFYSAAILKRHEATVLEAADGIIITVSGFINRSRTHENGFPSKVYNHFLLGFPFNWQDYLDSSKDDKSALQGDESTTSHFVHRSRKENLEPDLDAFAVTMLRDLLLSTYGESNDFIFMKCSKSESSSPMTSVESSPNETPKRCQKANSCEDSKDHDLQDNLKNDLVKVPSHAVQEAKSKTDMDFQVPIRGVSTRSMTRSGNSRIRSKEPPLSDSHLRERCEQNKSCENPGRRGQRDESSSSTLTINNSKADKEVAITNKSEGRRSSLRLRNRKQNQ